MAGDGASSPTHRRRTCFFGAAAIYMNSSAVKYVVNREGNLVTEEENQELEASIAEQERDLALEERQQRKRERDRERFAASVWLWGHSR